MHIGIDISRLGSPYATGVEGYARSLTEALLQKGAPAHRFSLYSAAKPREPLTVWPDNAQLKIGGPSRGWTLVGLPRLLALDPPDVLLVPSYTLPPRLPRKTRGVVTIHDVAFRRFPEAYPSKQRIWLDLTTRWSVHRADTLVTPTRAVAAEVAHFYRPTRPKITVIPSGFSKIAVENTALEAEKSWLQATFTQPYLLYIGRIEAKKNILRLVDAVTRLRDQGDEIPLILAGKLGFGGGVVQQKIRTQKLRNIHVLGYVSEARKTVLLQNARALILQSLAEGFGFPLLEGFSAGIPVVASDIPPLREVGEEACRYVNPLSVSSIAAAIQEVFENDTLSEALIQKGRARLQHFDWNQTAQAYLDLFERP